MIDPAFEWDSQKNLSNIEKHGISFYEAQKAFLDKNRIIARGLEHSEQGDRYYCFGKAENAVVTVRFTYRDGKIHIIGAGYWRKGKKIYEQEQKNKI
jgi:uncharacterized DUF497 family protein